MVYRAIIFAALLSLPFAAYAQTTIAPQPTVTTKKLCRDLMAYQPGQDTEYKEGQDAHGRKVVPADGGSDDTAKIDMPQTVDIAITVDQARKLNLPSNVGYKPEAYIGNVRVNTKTGDVYFNDKRISQTQVQALCVDQNKPKTKN